MRTDLLSDELILLASDHSMSDEMRVLIPDELKVIEETFDVIFH